MRSELDRKLVSGGFSSYTKLAAWLTEQGFEIGKSAVNDYGQALQRRLVAIKASTDAARLIAEAAPDDSDERSNAIISMTQTGLFDAIVEMQEAAEQPDPAKRVAILGNAAKNIATLARASVARHKWATDVREKASTAAEAASKIAKKGGLSAAAVTEIRKTILGIAQ